MPKPTAVLPDADRTCPFAGLRHLVSGASVQHSPNWQQVESVRPFSHSTGHHVPARQNRNQQNRPHWCLRLAKAARAVSAKPGRPTDRQIEMPLLVEPDRTDGQYRLRRKGNLRQNIRCLADSLSIFCTGLFPATQRAEPSRAKRLETALRCPQHPQH